MQITYLKVDNMFCFSSNQELRFEEPVYQVMGERIGVENHSNGTGKSSLYYIIQEVLYGKNIKKTLKEYTGNVFTDPNNYSASVGFDHFGCTYDVTLQRRNKKASLSIKKNEEDISAHTVPDTYKIIQEVLGVDYELFTMLTYLSPTISTPNTIFFGTPKEKKELFTKLFNLTSIITTVDKAASINRELLVELKASEKQVDSISNIIIPKLPETPDFPKLEELRTRKGKLTSLLEQLKVMIEGHNSWKKLLLEKKKIKEALSTVEIVDYDSNLHKVCSSQVANADQAVHTLKGKLAEYKAIKTKCPTCGTIFENREQILTNIKNCELDLNRALDAQGNLRANLKLFDDKAQKLKEYQRLEKSLADIEDRLNDFDKTVASIEEAIEKHMEIRAEISGIDNEIKILDQKITEYRQIEGKIETLKQLKNSEKEKELQLRSRIAELKTDIDTYSIIVDHLGINGFISTKIVGMAEKLTEIINSYLTIFSNNSLLIRFTGTDKLNFKLLKDNRELPINNLSAGQLTMIQLSSILALRSLITINKGITIDLLVLDELFGTLDSVRRDLLTDTLRDISLQTNNKVLSISHLTNDPSLPTIIIRQKGGISEIIQ